MPEMVKPTFEQPSIKSPDIIPPHESSSGEAVEIKTPPAPTERISDQPVAVTPVPEDTQPVDSNLDYQQLERKVETILADGLEATYRQLDPATQQRFKETGELTAQKITVLMRSATYQVKKIVDLIITWLRIIPGVNRFFLEQQAKIKADNLINLRRPPTP